MTHPEPVSDLQRRGGELNRPEGYTLVEIMLVILLIVMILSITTVFFANMLPQAGLRATGREIAATMRYAKYLAKSSNDRQLFVVDLDARTYSLRGHKTKTIPSGINVAVIDANLNAVRNGSFSIAYDAMGGNDWQSIILERGGRKITVAMDPVMTALVTEVKR